MNRPRRLLFNITVGTVLAVTATVLSVNVWSSNPIGSADSQVMLLRATGTVPEDSGAGSVSCIYSVLGDDQSVCLINALTGEAKQYREGSDTLSSASIAPVATGSNGSAAYLEGDSTVVVVNPVTRLSTSFSTFPVMALGVLSNGNIVVASQVRKNFLHEYNSEGKLLRSYGKIKHYSLPEVEEAQKRFLHIGKLLIDASDNVYYIFQYIPVLQKYSRAGNLLFERTVVGEAIDMQQAVAGRFANIRDPKTVGGIDILTAAAIDHKTGHLWVGMNGASNTGVVYEYSEQGEKIREYALQANSQRIIGVKGLAITKLHLYALTGQHQIFSFNIRDDSSWTRADEQVSVNTECGTQQAWPACPYTCPEKVCNGTTPTPTSSTGMDLDCTIALQTALQPGWTLVTITTCTTIQPGTGGTPPHMRGACKEDVVVCYGGQNFTAGVIVDCPAPPPGSCPGGGDEESCIFYWQGDSYCGLAANFTSYPSSGCGSQYYCDGGGCCCGNGGSPIVIDLRGNGFDLTNLASGVNFDLDRDGNPEHISWTSANSDDAWLALDRNGNGTIDDGGELFGNFTAQPPGPYPNGFLALAEFDKPAHGGNGDGRIDIRDSVFTSLRLWRDTNHNGISESNELNRLRSAGVTAVALGYATTKRVDQNGNAFRYRAKVYDGRGADVGQWAWDVFVVRQ